MFGDLFLWAAFSFLLWCFLEKPTALLKLMIFTSGIVIFFIVQAVKHDYRQKTWFEGEETGFSAFSRSTSEKFDINTLLSKEQMVVSLSRLNQGWILSSTVENMNLTQNFQQTHLVIRYVEAAILPRFLAPNKLNPTQNKEIFNEFSGHRIESTSMGLGVFADGYIAYGALGVYLFSFCLGIIFYGVFKIVDKWAALSPFFVLFLYPIFFYAIRPDCDTQTLLGHLVKSLIVFGFLVYVYKYYFKKMKFSQARTTRIKLLINS
jgi:hypothetical protein